MAIRKTVIILWLSLVCSLFTQTGCAPAAQAQENAEDQQPLAHIDRDPIVFAMHNRGCDMCNRSLELFYKEAFSRLGYTFAYNLYPLKRSLAESNAGRIDGECARGQIPPTLQKKYPNLIRVKEPIWESHISVYSMKPETQVNGWQDLKNHKNIVVGFSKGGVYLDRMVRQHRSTTQTFYGALNYTQGLRMLVSQRIDLLLGFSGAIDSILKKEEFRHKNIYNAGAVATLPLYPYLNKKYAHLAVPLASVLKQMKKEHIIDKYILQAQKEIFGPARKITISTGFEPPKKSSQNPVASFSTEISNMVTRAFALENYQVSFIFRSRLTAYNMAKEGLVDGTIPWRKTKNRNNYFYFSNPLIAADIVFFHLKSKEFNWRQLDDLGKYRAGIVEGMHYDDLFDAAVFSGRLASQISDNEGGNFKKLISGQIDYTPVILESGYDTISDLFPPKTAALFSHHPKPLIRQNFYLIVSKQIKDGQKIMADFNRGLYHLERVDASNLE